MTSTPSSTTPPPTPPRDPDAEGLSNPHTPAVELARIAATRPDLHPAIAAHPHCYPALQQWIDQYQAATTGSPAPAAGLAPANTPAPTTGPATSLAPATNPATTGTTHPQGPSRRTINRALPLLAGGAALATLSALGTWGLSHYLSEEPQDPTEEKPQTHSGEHRTFSISALSPDFARGVTEAWSIKDVDAKDEIISAKGDFILILSYEGPPGKESSHLLYPISASGPGTPVTVSASPWENEYRSGASEFSAHAFWWGDSPIWQDRIINPRNGDVTTVPWDMTSHLFLGAVDDSSALLLKQTPCGPNTCSGLSDITTGPISAIDRQGRTIWSTSESYGSVFFDPMQPDVLIGNPLIGNPNDMDRIMRIINTTTGETISQLPPSNGLIVCTDGVVTVTGRFSQSETLTARAFSFTGEPQWEQKIGNCEDIFFAGTPALDVVRRSLDELTGMAAVVTENGTVLVFNGESHGDYVSLSLRNKNGSTGPAINFRQPSTRILADGSGALTRRSDDDSSIDFVDFTTGKTKKCSDSDILNRDENDYYYRQSVKKITCLDFISRHILGMNRNCLIDISSSKVTCYIPKK